MGAEALESVSYEQIGLRFDFCCLASYYFLSVLSRMETEKMTECVILVRLNSGKVIAISEEDRLAVFKNMDEAVALADEHSLCLAMPYQIVELDEL